MIKVQKVAAFDEKQSLEQKSETLQPVSYD